jgi:hypothetical protein
MQLKYNSHIYIVARNAVQGIVSDIMMFFPYECYCCCKIKCLNQVELRFRSMTTEHSDEVYRLLKNEVATINIWNNYDDGFELMDYEGDRSDVMSYWMKRVHSHMRNLVHEHVEGDSCFPYEWEDEVYDRIDRIDRIDRMCENQLN